MKNFKLRALNFFFKQLSDLFVQHGIAGTFPIMIFVLALVTWIWRKRRKMGYEKDLNEVLLLLGAAMSILIFIVDQTGFMVLSTGNP